MLSAHRARKSTCSRQHLDPAKAPHRAEGLDLAEFRSRCSTRSSSPSAAVTFEDERLAAPSPTRALDQGRRELGDVVRDSRARGLQQLGGARQPHRDRPPDPGERPAPRSCRALAALSRAPHCAWASTSSGPASPPARDLASAITARSPSASPFLRPTRRTSTSTTRSPDDPHRYRYGDGWEAMRIVEETQR